MKRPFEISEKIYPFESNWIQIDGMDIHYLDEGNGPVILMCHGNPTWSLLYVPLIRLLKDRFRCIALDYPGFGMSAKPDLKTYSCLPADHSRIVSKFIDKLHLEKFSIFVQDWGGPIGLNAACKHATKVENLFIGNTWAWEFKAGTAMGDASRQFSQKMGGDEMKERVIQKNAFLNLTMRLLTRGVKKHNPELKKEIETANLAPFTTPESRLPTWIFPRSIIHSSEFLKQLDRKLHLIANKPGILFWAMQDVVFPTALIAEWKERFSNLQKIELPEASHFFQEEEPELIAKSIISIS